MWNRDVRVTPVVLVGVLMALVPLPAVAACVAPQASLIGWWRGEGNAAEVAGRHDGTTVGAGFGSANVGQGFSMNGGSAYVSIPDAPALRPATLTIEGWFMFTSVPSWASLVSKPLGSGIDDSFALFYDAGALKGQTSNGSTATIISHAWTPTLNAWHHLAFTFDGSVEALYIDGQQVATLPNTTTPAYDANPLLIGADDDHPFSGFFPGMIDDVTLYGAALPPSAIAAIHQAGTSGKCVNAAPAIASLSRSSGPPAGRTPVTITGTGFDAGATVTFGGTPAMDVVVASSTTIHCAAPARAAGAATVVVANPDLQNASSPYTYIAPSSADPYAATVLSHSPVAYYRLGEGAPGTTAYDSSGNDFHAANSGATPGAPGVTWNDGAFSFGGSGSLTLGGTWGGSSWQQLTIEAWVNVAATTGDFQAAVSASDAAFAHLQLFGSGSIVVYTDAGQLALPVVSQSPTGTWRHVALTAASGNTRLYVDGVEVGSSSAVFSSIVQSVGVQIGSGFGGGRAFNGRIDEVALYDRALSAPEVQSHVAARASGEVHWINASGGNWSTPSNWSTGVVPNGSNPVYIDASGTYTVVVDVAASAAALTLASGVTLQVASNLTLASGGTVASGATLRLAGGTLSDSGAMTVNGALDWTNGTLSGSGTLTIASGATLALTGTTYKYIVGRTIELYGSMTWSGYAIRGSGGPTLNVRPGGEFDVRTDFGIDACCAGGAMLTINVAAASGALAAGRIIKTAGGDTTFNAIVNNAGVLSPTVGSINLAAGGTSSGLFEAVPSAASCGVWFSGGTHTITGTFTTNAIGQHGIKAGGTVVLGADVTSNGWFYMLGGTLQGAGTFNSNDRFLWENGAIVGPGVLNIAAGTTFELATNTYKTLQGRTVNLAGTMTWMGYPLRGSLGAVLNVLPGGLLTVSTSYGIDACCAGGAALTINVSAASGATPAGRIMQNGGGNSTFNAVLNNAGLVSAFNGSLTLAGGGTSSGLFEAKPSSGTNGIYFSGGTHSITGSFETTAGGTIAVIGGTFSVDGPTTSSAAFNLAGGTFTGAGTLTSLGSFDWTGGVITGSGALDLAAGTTFALSGLTYKDLAYRTINLAGTMTYEGYPLRGSQGPVLNILPGGSLVAKTDYGIAHCCSGGSPMTINVSAAASGNPAGRIDKQVTTGQTDVWAILNNAGEVSPTSGTLAFHSGGASSGTFTVTSSGATPGIVFGGGTHDLTGSLGGNAGGIIGVSGGTVNFGGVFTAGPTIAISGGVANFNASASTASVTLTGGTLSGTGTVTATTSFSWTGGSMSGIGSTDVAAGATMTISGNTYKDIVSRTINVAGAAAWRDYPIRGSLGSELNVLPGGSFMVETDHSIEHCCSGGDPLTISVSAPAPTAGFIGKQTATGVTWINAILNNDGEVNPSSGTLTFTRGGTSSGAFLASSSTTTPGIVFGGGTHNLTGSLGGNPSGIIGVSGGTATFTGTFVSGPTIAVSGGVANFDSDVSTAAVTLSGGMLSGIGTLTATSSFAWTGGTLGGSGTLMIPAGATATLSGSTYKDLISRTIGIAGTLIWRDYPLRASQGAVFNVLAGGLFDVQTDHTLEQCCSGGNPLTINVSAAPPLAVRPGSPASQAVGDGGTIGKQIATGTTYIHAILNNAGRVAPSSGTLTFTLGGTSSGTFLASSSTTAPGIVFGGGTHNLTGSLGGNPSGIIGVSGGTATFTGTFVSGPTIAVSGGVASFDTHVSTAAVRLSGGTLSGIGTLTTTSTFEWTGGTLAGNGRLLIPAGATATLSGSTYKDLVGRTIEVGGTLIWRDYPLRASQGAVLTVAAGGLFDVQTNHTLEHCCSGGNPLTINVSAAPLPTARPGSPASESVGAGGTIGKQTATGNTNINAVLNNAGQVAPASGTLTFTAGGTSSGSFLANGTTTPGIVFAGGTHDLSGSLGGSANGLIGVTGGAVNFTGTFTGGPTVAISGGVANFASAVSTAGVRLSGGSLAGVGTLTATSTFDWTGGSISGGGRIVIPAGAAMTLSGSTYKDLLSRTIDVEGTLTWRDYPLRGSLGPILNVLPGGVFDVQTDHWIEHCCSGGSPLTINVHAASPPASAGRLTKNLATGTTPMNARLNNDGLVAPVSGTIELTAGGMSSGAFVVTPPGSVAFTGGTHDLSGTFGGDPTGVIRFGGGTVNVTSTFTGGPTWRLDGATTNVSGSASLANVELVSGGVYVNGTLTATSAFAWTGGFLAGTGALEIPTGGTMTLSGSSYKDTILATLNNRGSVVLRDYPVRASLGAQFVNHAGSLFDIQTDQGIAFCCSGGTRPSFTNAGTLRKSAGVGTSVLETTLVNDGLVDLITGRITVVPSFVQGAAPATTKVTIAGPGPNTGYGVLGVTGPATLDGIFEVALANGYTPATASSYAPVTFESATGDFATKNGLVFPGGSFGYSRNATNVVLTATGCTAPPSTITAPATVCPNSSGNVASAPLTAGATYAWTVTNGAITSGQGTDSITFSVGTASPVTLTVEVAVPGCQNSGTTSVAVAAPQPVIAPSGPTTFCVGGSVLLDAGSGYASYLWSNGANTQTIEVSESGSFSVTVTNDGGCAATSGAVNVSATAAPTATSITSSPNPAFEGQSITLGATVTPAGCTPAGPTATPTVDGVLGENEWASAKRMQFAVNAGRGSSIPAALYLTTDASNVYAALRVEGTALPAGSLFLEFPAAPCAGSDVVVYDFTTGLVDQFRDSSCTVTADTAAGGTSDGTAARAEAATYTFYELSHPLASGDSGRDLAAVAGDALAFAAVVTFCPSGCEAASLLEGTLVIGTASPRGSITFFDGTSSLGTVPVVGGHASLTVPSLPAGTHSISAHYAGDPAFAASSSGTVAQAVNPTCSASISPSGATTFCSGGSVVLTASPGASYQWFSGGSPLSGATAQTLSVTTSGDYTVQVTAASGCLATSSAVTVTVNTPATPTITASGPTTFCPGGSVTLQSSTAASYEWFNGTTPVGTSSSITVSAAGTYSVRVVDANGCSATSSPVVVTVDTPPAPTVTPSGLTSFCSGGSVVLTASAGASYQWFSGGSPLNGETAQTLTVGASGSYAVQVTAASGCSATSSPVTVTVNAPVTPTVTASGPTSFCTGGSVTLQSSTGASYEWFNGTTPVGTSSSITVSAAGTYSVRVVDGNGCSATSSPVVVTVDTPPAPTVTPSGPTSFCTGGSVTLTASAGTAYQWLEGGAPLTGATAQSLLVTASGSYSVRVTQAGGCSARSADVTVVVNAAPATPVITAPGSVCASSRGHVAAIGSQSGATYEWSIANGTIVSGAGSTSVTFDAASTGPVTLGVKVTIGGCSASATIPVPVAAAAVVSISGPDSVCAGAGFTLEAPAGFSTYLWSNGATTRTVALEPLDAPERTYRVTVTTPDGCTASAEKRVVLRALPPIAIRTPASSCAGETSNVASIDEVTGATYAWTITNGRIVSGADAATVVFETPTAGTSELTVVIAVGECTTSATATVAVSNPPVASISAPSNVAAGSGSNAASTAARAGATYVWTVTNGSITGGAGTNAILFIAGSSGVVGLSLTILEGSCLSTTRVDVPICPVTPPTLLSPADGATGVASPVTLQWSAVEGSTAYEVWLDDGSGPRIAATVTSTEATVSVPSGSTSWHVVARVGACAPLRSVSRRFVVRGADNCASNPAPVLTAPAAASNVGTDVTFSWTAVPGAIGYRVIVRVGGGAPQDVGTTTATTLTVKLSAGEVVASVEALFSGCAPSVSAPVAFTVTAPDPCAGRATAALTSPVNGATLSAATVQFAWLTVAEAAEYRVLLRRGEGEVEELGRTAATTLVRTLEPGSYTWSVEALFKGCAATSSAQFSFAIPQAAECPTAGVKLLAPAAGAVLIESLVPFTWEPVAGALGYELWVARADGAPTLLGATTATSLSQQASDGPSEWFVRTIYDRCASVDSERRTFNVQPPPQCDGLRAPILLAPGEGESVTSPAHFSWSGIEAAARYELWVRGASGEDVRMHSGRETSVSLALPVGAVSWYVRAIFEGCGSRDSTEARTRVVEPPPACQTPEAPTVSVPSEISSGARFGIRWSEVPGATSYVVQVARDGEFTRPDSQTIEAGAGNVFEVQEVNDEAQPRALFLRVRAIDSNCATPRIGLYSNTAIVYVLPQVTSDATLPISDRRTVTYQVPLGGELAGRAFTATANQSWLTVTPSSGVVPAGGMFLTVSAAAGDLPPGTSLGGITITLLDGVNGNLGSEGTTTYTTPISVNLVSPVSSSPKTSPPPDALIIPAVAHAAGVNAQFQSDVRLTNTSAETRKYQLSFVPTGEAGITAGMQTTVDVDAGATVALDDVLKTWFASGTQNVTGTLEIRPLSQSKVNAAASGTLQNLLTFASSRTFNVTSQGTFGQHIPAIPFAKFLGKGSSDAVLSLQQIAQSESHRTNLGFVEGSGEPASLLVSVFGKGATKLLEFPVELKGGQHLQLNSILAQKGVAVEDGRVEVKVTSGAGKVTAYASVLDNRTNDPLLVTPQAIAATGLTSWVLPGVADLQNGAANWRTDVRLYNAGASRVSASLRFHSQNGGEAQTAALTLEPGEVRVLDGVLTNLFSAAGEGGALHVVTQTPTRLTATARTYNQTAGGGTYGQFIPAVTQADAAAVGTRPLQILQVEQSERFRTNVGLAEITGRPLEVEVTAVVPESKVSPVMRVQLAANEFRQMNSLLAAMGLGTTYNARLTVRAVNGSGKVAAYGSVIDARTQDPTYIPAQ